MPVNPYVSWNSFRNTGEQQLAENLMIEVIKMYGMDVMYLPKDLNNIDQLFGESPLTSFDMYYTIEMYFNDPEGYQSPNPMISATGFQLAPTCSFTVAKRRFTEEVLDKGPYNTKNPAVVEQDIRPMEGDWLYVPLTKDLWEIKYVDWQRPFMQLGQVAAWTITVEKAAYSSEMLNTGNPDIDKIEDAYSHDMVIPATDGAADNTELATEEPDIIDDSEVDPFSDGDFTTLP